MRGDLWGVAGVITAGSDLVLITAASLLRFFGLIPTVAFWVLLFLMVGVG